MNIEKKYFTCKEVSDALGIAGKLSYISKDFGRDRVVVEYANEE